MKIKNIYIIITIDQTDAIAYTVSFYLIKKYTLSAQPKQTIANY